MTNQEERGTDYSPIHFDGDLKLAAASAQGFKNRCDVNMQIARSIAWSVLMAPDVDHGRVIRSDGNVRLCNVRSIAFKNVSCTYSPATRHRGNTRADEIRTRQRVCDSEPSCEGRRVGIRVSIPCESQRRRWSCRGGSGDRLIPKP